MADADDRTAPRAFAVRARPKFREVHLPPGPAPLGRSARRAADPTGPEAPPADGGRDTTDRT